MKPKVAIIRGKFLNKFEMQFYEVLSTEYDITAFGSRYPYHSDFAFPVVTLPSPMDIVDFPFKMPILNRLFTDAHYLYGLERQLQGFDLVHSAETYYTYTQQALNAKKKGYVKKVISTVLENIPFNNEGIHGRKAYKKRSREELDYIIALTERTKAALLLEGAEEKKIGVVSHFIDTEQFKPNTKPHSQNKITIVFSGRLETYKGVYEILYAASLLSKDTDIQHPVEYVFVGKGTEYDRMKEVEERLGISKRVRHMSVDYDQMPKMYDNADIYVAPSKSTSTWTEQYNTTLLEAQSCGLPIVTTWSGGIPENVGEAAVMIPPDDSYALYMALKDFILFPQKRLEYGKKARSRALKVHDKHIGADKIKKIWDRVLWGT